MRWNLKQQSAIATAMAQGLFPQIVDNTLTTLTIPDETKEPVWIHVATSGEYNGYKNRPFQLNSEVFETMIRNFKADPRFTPGDAGVGTKKVVPFDYEHASELPAFVANVENRSAAPAWALDLKMEEEDGKQKLFALTQLGDKVRNQILDEEIQFTSIAFKDATDQKTGKPIGPRISSIAFTNKPFIQDLEPIAVAASALGEAMQSLGGGVPAPQLIETGSDVPKAQDTSPADSGGDVQASTTGESIMLSELGKKIALKFQDSKTLLSTVTALASDEDVEGAVDETMKAAEAGAESAGNLDSIFKALGIEDMGGAMETIAAFQDAKAKLQAALAKIDEMTGTVQQVEEAQMEADVDAALTAKSLDESVKEALKGHRAAMIDSEITALSEDASQEDRSKAREEGRKKFLANYGVPEKQHAHLLSLVVAQSTDEEPASEIVDESAPRNGEKVITLSDNQGGANMTLRACAVLAGEDAEFAKLPTHAQVAEVARRREAGDLRIVAE